VSLSQLHAGGHEKARAAIGALAEAVANAKDLTSEQKNELLEQIEFLSSQAASGAPARKPGMIKATVGSVASIASTVKGVADAWAACEPILKGIFGLS
jgi:Sec-independent protein translocase protein TatA